MTKRLRESTYTDENLILAQRFGTKVIYSDCFEIVLDQCITQEVCSRKGVVPLKLLRCREKDTIRFQHPSKGILPVT